jgi:hypothetical protein
LGDSSPLVTNREGFFDRFSRRQAMACDLSIIGGLVNRLKILSGHPRQEGELRRLQNRAIESFSADTLAGEFYEMVEKTYTTDTKNF